MAGKSLKNEDKRAAIGLWSGKVPVSKIRKQLKKSERTLRRILSFAKAYCLHPITPRKLVTGRPREISMETSRIMKKNLHENPSLTAVKLRRSIPTLACVSIRGTQNCCLKDLQLPSSKKAKNPLLTKQMREQRLEFAREHVTWEAED
jgi:hypothetical protein